MVVHVVASMLMLISAILVERTAGVTGGDSGVSACDCVCQFSMAAVVVMMAGRWREGER